MTEQQVGLPTALPTLSASKLKTFNTCERRFYYDYIEKVETAKHPAAALGTAVHKTIEQVYKGAPTMPAMLFKDNFDIELTKNNIERAGLKPEYERDGMKMVTVYPYQRRTPAEMELEFLLQFPNQAHPLCQIHGFMDQTFDWGFVDLKTNKYKPLNSVLDNDLQFIIYDWAFEQIYGYKATNRIWHHLRTGEDLYADTPGKLDNAVRVIEKILEAQITGIYDRRVGDACRLCAHRLPCLGRAD